MAPPDVAAALAALAVLLLVAAEEDGARLMEVIEATLDDEELTVMLEVFDAVADWGMVTVTLGRVVAEYGAALHWSI